MPKVTVLDRGGNQVDELVLSDEVFGIEVKPHLIHNAVVAQLDAKRLGTVGTKTRSEVAGGGRKPWRQKGTGRARHGSIRSPIWVGGGIAFGPKPKDYRNKLPRKMKRQALRSVLSASVAEKRFIVLDELKLDAPRTKAIVELLENLNLGDHKILLLIGGKDKAIYKSARNLPGVTTRVVEALTTYDVANHDYTVATMDAVAHLEEVLSP